MEPTVPLNALDDTFTLQQWLEAAAKALPNAIAWISKPELLTVAALLAVGLPASASSPKEKVVCSPAQKSTWMTEAEARKLFRAEEYALVKFKVSKGNCYEFYAVKHQGDVVEAYIHPATGEEMRRTLIPAATSIQKPLADTQPK